MKNQKFSNIYDLLDTKPKNISQLLGEFGEYVYRSYCKQQQLLCKITKYLRADVIIFHNSREYFVDVKTTISNEGTYKGQRPQKKYNYAYEQVFINKDFMKIYPDDNSLLKEFTNSNNEILIDNTNEQYQKYLRAPTETKHITNSEINRDEIRNKIEKLFLYKNLKCRILERGQVSDDGWGKHTPDNVPGKKNLYQKYDYNILINYKDIEFDKEEIKEIYLFKTSLIGSQIKLIEPILDIQKKKKIEGLIDYDDFKKDNSKYYFTNLDSFYSFVDKLS
jgi:hypothetical protein|tara:strand:- start:7601 stop:8434 length:834 start_codon:yes stop_codon:yes gene_type:complete